MQESCVLSFDGVSNHSQSQVRITPDMMIFGVDLVMSVTGKDRNSAARVLRRLSDDIFPVSKLVKRNVIGIPGNNTTVLSFPDAIELIMVLPGKTAKSIRRKFVDIIMQYMSQDPHLKELVPGIDMVSLIFRNQPPFVLTTNNEALFRTLSSQSFKSQRNPRKL